MAFQGQHFNTCPAGHYKRLRIGGVEICSNREAVAVLALDNIQHGCTVSRFYLADQFTQMLGAARSLAVGKLVQAGLAHQMDVLDLDEAWRQAGLMNQKVDAAVLAVFLFGTDLRIRQNLNQAVFDGLARQPVRQVGVDADQRAIGLDDFQRVAQLAGRVLAVGDEGARSRCIKAEHGAGIGAVDGDDRAIRHFHISEKPLVAFDKRAGDEIVFKLQGFHQPVSVLPLLRRAAFITHGAMQGQRKPAMRNRQRKVKYFNQYLD